MTTPARLQRAHAPVLMFLVLLAHAVATWGGEQPAPLRTLHVGGTPAPSRVPDAWQQGAFAHPQCITALDVTSDGRSIGVTTLAFRHDRNFWLLGDGGNIAEGRYVLPWAPFQVAVLPGARAFGVGLAYSRLTGPRPTLSLLEAGKTDETAALEDDVWEGGWLRYGSGDWRTGWPVSFIGDLLVRADDAAFTVRTINGPWHLEPDGSHGRCPGPDQRSLRMTASGDGRRIVRGYIVPDGEGLDERTRGRLRIEATRVVDVRDAEGAALIWSARPWGDAPRVPPLPEPAGEFPDMAEEFNMHPRAVVPFRAAVAVGLNGDGSRAALTEYGGWLRVKQERGIGRWNPDHPVPFCPRQRGRLRVFDAGGEELAGAELPSDGLFEVRLDRSGNTAWCAPLAWFARGLAGRAWLPADPNASVVFLYDVHRRAWTDAWHFPDAVSDVGVHPDGDRALVSCWDGIIYLVGRDGTVRRRVPVGQPAVVRWADDGRSAVVGTQGGEVWAFDADGEVVWKTVLPAATVPEPFEPNRPVFEDAPVYVVGRVGPEHAYVGDIWLVKAKEGAFLVDSGGTSAVPLTWQRVRAAGVEPVDLRHLLLTHSHGDHAGGAYLWRTQGLRVVAPATSAYTINWLMPTWSDYGIWAPVHIDQPLSLARAGDEAEFTVSGQIIRAVFVPGHSFDSVIYLMELGGKRVAFTGDLGFQGQDILHRCWGDRDKAGEVLQVVRDKVLPFKPDYVFTGHDAQREGMAFLEDLVQRTEAALRGQ